MNILSCGGLCGGRAILYRDGFVSRPLRQSFYAYRNTCNKIHSNCRNPLEKYSSYSKSNTKASKGYKSPDDAFFVVSCGGHVVEKSKDKVGDGWKIIHVYLKGGQ